MKLSLVLLMLGVLGFCLSSNETVEPGGSIQDEFAVSIRARTHSDTNDEIIPVASPEQHEDSLEVEGRR